MFDEKKNFIFDLYGTLVDIRTDENMPILWSTMARYYSMKGAHYDEAEFHEAYSELCAKLVAKAAGKRHSEGIEIDLAQVFKELFTNKGSRVFSSEVEAAAITFRSISTVKLCLFPDALDVLRKLRKDGKKLFLFTNAQAAFTIPELESLDIYGMFEGVQISSVIGAQKPSKKFFDAAIKNTGINVKESVMIGNDEFSDIRGSMAAGLDACYIQTEQSPTVAHNLPCPSIRSLGELLG
ncbi:MAG: HAD family hydrolase [Saccharofermentans sp.]|jgi:putative hydrolase of the HAD superfamily|nr:HAD family hydrolase [Mageeibacillus sp.]MCI1264634.1 HAD family hydrolase [Saccharofermentans sp.]MCI1274618.1 HAD family hydrolase [Saccharofermentans sp.]MCI1768685.1 HAD family hydrolase [Mageeibacillus sp.]